jgi:3-phenylpropionate/trans-cinnamate dioxygenase ferredoxin reductase component
LQRFDILIVGGGHAGAQAAIALRQRGHAGSIAIVGEEAELPYERPPLSKEYLAGAKAPARLLIRPAAFWAERKVELVLGERVVAIDAGARLVRTGSGRAIGYGALIWAAGGHARRLACRGGDLAGVHSIRTRSDVDLLRRDLAEARRIVVIGAGYIGLEAAAVLVGGDRDVLVVEAQPRPLARVAGEAVAGFFRGEHERHGVRFLFGAVVRAIDGEGGRVTAVLLEDGTRLPADVVIVGIGLVPAIAPVLQAGAEGGNGILVDRACRTGLPAVFAIGDCALHRNRYAGGEAVRLESVQNANDMAVTVAAVLTGTETGYDAVPWFWSNQYDLRLQTVGLSSGHDLEVVRGDPAGRSFSVAYLRRGRVIALDCVNAPRDYVGGRALVAGHADVEMDIDVEALADVDRPLMSFLPGA